jgi:hypothetical protein
MGEQKIKRPRWLADDWAKLTKFDFVLIILALILVGTALD